MASLTTEAPSFSSYSVPSFSHEEFTRERHVIVWWQFRLLRNQYQASFMDLWKELYESIFYIECKYPWEKKHDLHSGQKTLFSSQTL